MTTASNARTRQGLVGLLLLGATLLAIPSSASAFTAKPVWNCRASALYTSLAGNNRVEPIVANGNPSTANNKSPDRAQCASEEAGADNLATPLGIPDNVIAAQTASAKTTIEPELGLAIDQKVTSTARVEKLALPLGGTTVILGVGAANSRAVGACVNNAPVLIGDSSIADVTLGGNVIPLNQLAAGLQQLLEPLGVLVDVKFNEKIMENGSLVVRAAHIKVLRGGSPGSTPLLDVVIAESRVTADADTCNPDRQFPGFKGKICPTGSRFDTISGFCIIPAVNGGSGIIVVGRPFEGPSGGTVLGLREAIKKFGNRECLRGTGPKFAVVGTNGPDRITGTNKRDRILGLGGNDSLDGGRGDDCIEGNNGNDRFNGGIGNDRLIGGAGNDTMTGNLGNDNMDGNSGNDKVNGGPGADRMNGGSGRDILNAGFGADRVNAGSGNDIINVAVQGPSARVDCGSGRDKIRLNQRELKTIRNCEITYVLKDNAIKR